MAKTTAAPAIATIPRYNTGNHSSSYEFYSSMNIASSLLCEIYDVCTYVFIYHLASNYGVGFVYVDIVATSMLRMYHKFLVRMNVGLTLVY